MAKSRVSRGTGAPKARKEKPVSQGIRRAAERAGIVTLTVEVGALSDLFMGGNNSGFGGDRLEPISMALDIIEHAAEELYMVHDALTSESNRDEDVALHAWRISRQLLAGASIVKALRSAGGAL